MNNHVALEKEKKNHPAFWRKDLLGTLLSTQMALLHLSADIPYVGTQKDIYGLKFS